MPDISNHELDKLFQEAAAGIKPKFDPADWERLAQRLDQEDTTSFARTISLYSIAVLMGLISIFPGRETSFASTAEQVRTDSYEGARSEELEARSEKPVPRDFRGGVRRDGSEVTIQESVRKDSQEEVGSEDGGVSESGAGKPGARSQESEVRRQETVRRNSPGEIGDQRSAVKIQSGGIPSKASETGKKKSAGSDAISGVSPSDSVNILAPVQHSAGSIEILSSRTMQEKKVEKEGGATEVGREKPSVAKTSSREVSTDKPAGKQESMGESVNAEVSSSSDRKNVLVPAERPADTGIILEKKVEKESKGTPEKEKGSEEHTFDKVSAGQADGKSEDDSVSSKVSSSGELKKSGSMKSGSRPAGSGSSESDSVKVSPVSPSVQRVSGSGLILIKAKEEGNVQVAGSGSEQTSTEALAREKSFEETRDQQSSDGADSIHATDLKQNKKQAVVTDHGASVSSQDDSIKILKPVQRIADSTAVVAAAEEEEKEKEKTAGSKWFLKLPVSPDFTSISYYKPGKTGLNIGLLVEYIPGKHLAFSTGAIWSRKLYSTENPGTSYSSGPYSSKVSFLDGDCRVLDIPVNITYYLPLRTRTTFFATAGLSSYIMLKEKYTYTVTANNHDYYYSEDYTRKNNEWFSMLNLSIGIQRQIGERFWLQAEPFLKAPLSGIGEGKVDLVSMGAFFAIKYQLKK